MSTDEFGRLGAVHAGLLIFVDATKGLLFVSDLVGIEFPLLSSYSVVSCILFRPFVECVVLLNELQ